MSPQTTPASTAKEMRKVVAGSIFGTAMETYDMYLYATAAALIFGPLFFSSVDPGFATILSLATFAVSFIARPVGAIVFGHFGDRIGRKKMLFVTLILMGTATALIGLLPTFDQVGIIAPLLLTFLRFIQGFAFGGEYTGAVLILAEHAPAERRGYYAGLNNVGPVIGFITSTTLFIGVSLSMSEQAFFEWGWRIPFLVSLLLVVIGVYVRSKVAESPLFEAAQKRAETAPRRLPLTAVFAKYPKEIVLAIGANLGQFATFYLASTWALNYGTTTLGLERNVLLTAVMIAVATNAISTPLAAALSDRFGRKRILIIGSAAIAAWAFPFFALFNTGQYGLIVLAFLGLMISYSFVYGPVAAFTSELFGISVRYTGAAISYSLGSILGAAFAPLISAALFSSFNSTTPIALYLVGISLVSLLCIALARETTKVDMAEDRVTGVTGTRTDDADANGARAAGTVAAGVESEARS